MGRRKIEIKAIKDDRNRSVTFLKRKGGLFKKAHELSVLCSVDVAVIIFGNNKKLYEYSSSDIGEILQRYQFYGGANEHKGPADFNGKKDLLDDDDDDDMGTPPQDHNPQMMPPQYQHPTNQFQHIRHHTSSASPPIPNGVPFHHAQQRQHTPQPHQISRPASRNDGPRRVSSNLSHHGMPQVSGPPPGVNGFGMNGAFMPNPSIYNPNASPMPPGMQQHPHQPPQQQQHPQQPSFQYPAPPPPPHLQQVYMEDARRQSMPPAFPQVERAASIPHGSPPQPQQPQVPQPVQQQQPQPQPQPQSQPQPQPQPKQEQVKQESRQQQMLEPIKKASKQRSIFTPIDEDRSVLSKHWASSTTAADTSKIEPPANRSQSVDVAAVNRNGNGAIAPPPSPPKTGQSQAHQKDRNSLSSIDFQPPSRTNSGMSQMGPNAKRPRLKVQIPDEPSDNDSQTAESNNSAQGTNSSHPSRPNAGTDSSQSGGPGSTMGIMTLPPPSPSTSTIQSAGATGPPNPFARPLPPSNTNSSSSNLNQQNQNSTNGTKGLAEIETPVSALPSRFMNNEFLPSPSSFYPEWNFRKGNESAGGMGMDLQSPLNFATPVVGSGPSFLRDEAPRDKEVGLGLGSMKRKSPDGESEGSAARGDEAKRVKHEA